MNQEEFHQALSRLADRDISPELFQKLEEYLLESEEARNDYREFMHLQSLIGLEINVHHGQQKVVPIERIISRQKRRALKVAVLSAAAIFLIGLVTMRLFFVSEKEPTLVFKISPETQFAITHSGLNDDDPTGQIMENGSRIQISHGVVELNFSSGVKSIITAPADLTLHDDDVLFLNHGVAWFHVPENAIGFQVKTRDVIVTDLGTEFGVISSNDRLDEVHVFDGEVEVLNLNSLKHKELLVAKQARIAGAAGRLKSTPLRVVDFRKSLPTRNIPTLVFQNQFNSGGREWRVEGNARFVAGVYEGDNCPINTEGEDDHSGLHFDVEGHETPAFEKFFAALGHEGRPPLNRISTRISVVKGKTYNVYFRYTGSRNGTQRVTASLILGKETSSTGQLSAPNAEWTSASFSFTPKSSGEAVLKFEDTGSSQGAYSDLLLDSVLVTSLPNNSLPTNQ